MNDQNRAAASRTAKNPLPVVEAQPAARPHSPENVFTAPALLYRQGTIASQADLLTRANGAQKQTMLQQIGRTQGNRHVQRVVAAAKTTPTIQTRLSVSEPADPFEIEADQVADQVMKMPALATPPDGADDGSDQGTGKNTTSLRHAITPLARCASRAAANNQVSAQVESQVASLASGGAPLPASERDFFEPRFGVDLSQVRLHTGSVARQTSQELNARAYTVGSDIAFNVGEYQPGSSEGRRLMAHELTHVIQQTGSSLPAPQAAPEKITASLQTDKHIQRQDGGDDPFETIQDLLDNPFSSLEALLVAWWDVYYAAPGDAFVSAVEQNFGLWEQSIRRDARIWLVFAESDLVTPTVVEFFENHLALFEETAGRDEYTYNDIAIVKELKRKFENDVYDTARHYLRLNEEFIRQEGCAIGKALDETDQDQVNPDHVAYLLELQQVARQVLDAQRALADLERIPVGYIELSGYYYYDEYGTLHVATMPIYFSPSGPPNLPPTGAEDPPMPTWEEISEMYQMTLAAIDILKNSYPSIYALDENERLEEFASAESPEIAQDVAGDSLNVVLTNIRESLPRIGGDIKFRDLQPICQQILSGTQIDFAVETNWTHLLAQSVARHHVEAGEGMPWWQILGIGLSLAAIVVMPLSAIAATTMLVVATGASVYQAVNSWDRYRDLSQAADTNVRDELEVVADYTVTAAFGQAILDTVFAFLDVTALGGEALELWRAIRSLGKADTIRLINASDNIFDLVAAMKKFNNPDEFVDMIRAVGVDEFIEMTSRIGVNSAVDFVRQLGPDMAVELATKYGDNLVHFADTLNLISAPIDEIVVRRVETAFDFYLTQGMDGAQAVSHVRCINMAQPVEVVTLSPGTVVYQWQVPGGPQGSYYAVDQASLPTHLGVYDQGYNPAGELMPRVQTSYMVVGDNVQVLRSTADAVNADWIAELGIVSTEGGAVQYFTINSNSFVPLAGGGE